MVRSRSRKPPRHGPPRGAPRGEVKRSSSRVFEFQTSNVGSSTMIAVQGKQNSPRSSRAPTRAHLTRRTATLPRVEGLESRSLMAVTVAANLAVTQAQLPNETLDHAVDLGNISSGTEVLDQRLPGRRARRRRGRGVVQLHARSTGTGHLGAQARPAGFFFPGRPQPVQQRPLGFSGPVQR